MPFSCERMFLACFVSSPSVKSITGSFFICPCTYAALMSASVIFFLLLALQ